MYPDNTTFTAWWSVRRGKGSLLYRMSPSKLSKRALRAPVLYCVGRATQQNKETLPLCPGVPQLGA